MFRFRFTTFTVFSFMFNDKGPFLNIKINREFGCRYCWCSCSWCICHIRLGSLFLFIFIYWFWINTWYGYGSSRLVRSGFSSLLFRTLNFLTLFQLLDVNFAVIALVSSFAFKKKATKCEWLLLHEGSGTQRVGVCGGVVFMWGGVSGFDNSRFQSNVLFEHLLPICSTSVQTKNIHA